MLETLVMKKTVTDPTQTIVMTYPRKTNTRHQKTLDMKSAGHINAIDEAF